MSNAYQLYRQQRRSGGERKLDLLNFGEVLLIHIIDVFENQEREICFPQRRGCRASVMKFGGAMDHWVGRVSGDRSILLWGVQCWVPSQWLTEYLGLALVFMWNGTRQEDFNFFFSGAFC